MRKILAVIVFDRLDNIIRWIECWKQCEQDGFELVVIHNDNGQSEDLKKVCDDNQILYVKRANIGFDIGAFQDVCAERLPGFPKDWNKMIWCTDDILTIKRNFISFFTSKDSSKTLPCFEISKEVTLHIRTTGFLITKQICKKIQFPAPQITTKNECYHFEHRGGKDTFYHQIVKLGLVPTMITPLNVSPLWDTGNKRHLRLNRWAEYQKNFPNIKTNIVKSNPKVTIICPIFNSYPKIIGELMCQTHQNWELLLVHDGKSETDLIQKLVDATNDERIKYWETKERVGTWGHKIRRDVLDSLKNSDTEYVLIGNPDNSIAPVFLERMLEPMIKNRNYIASYHSLMVHSYKDWDIIPCRLKRGFIDCMGAVIRKEVACDVGFVHVEEHSADYFYFEDIIKKYGSQNFALVKGCLLVHN